MQQQSARPANQGLAGRALCYYNNCTCGLLIITQRKRRRGASAPSGLPHSTAAQWNAQLQVSY